MTQDERQEASKRLEKLRKDFKGSKKNMTSLPLLAGPVTANLHTVLKQSRICTQAYHSRFFVGNHCNKYLKEPTYTSLCQSVLLKTRELTTDPVIIAKAQNICEKFTQLNSLYSDIHSRFSHQRPTSQKRGACSLKVP